MHLPKILQQSDFLSESGKKFLEKKWEFFSVEKQNKVITFHKNQIKKIEETNNLKLCLIEFIGKKTEKNIKQKVEDTEKKNAEKLLKLL